MDINNGYDTPIKNVIEGHKEALVIILDPDADNPGESKIGVFTKLSSTHSILSAMLDDILINLKRTRNGKSCSNPLEDKTTSTPQKHSHKDSKDSTGSCKTVDFQNTES